MSIKLLVQASVKGGVGSGNYGHTGRPGMVGGSGGKGGVGVRKAVSAKLSGGKVADNNLLWESEETIKGQVIIEHDEDEPNENKLKSFLKSAFDEEELVPYIGSEDVEDIQITDVEHHKGYSVLQVDITPTVEAGEYWLEEMGGAEEWGTYHEL